MDPDPDPTCQFNRLHSDPDVFNPLLFFGASAPFPASAAHLN